MAGLPSMTSKLTAQNYPEHKRSSTCVQVALLIYLEHPRLIPQQLFLAVIISEAMCT